MSFGISLVSGTLIESVDVESKVETKVLVDSGGYFAQAMNFDKQFNFSVKGKGQPAIDVGPASVGGAVPGILSGQIFITSVKYTQTNDDWEGFEYSGVAYPNSSTIGCA